MESILLWFKSPCSDPLNFLGKAGAQHVVNSIEVQADDSTLHSHKKSLDHVEELAREPFFAQVGRKSGNSIASVLQQDWKLILQPSKSNIPR